jgi:hypothetical protein
MAEFDRYIAPDGQVYDFDDQVDQWLLTINNQGMPPIEHITTRGVFQHGETWRDYRLRPRTIRLTHLRETGTQDRADFWAARANILDSIRPNRGTTLGALRKQLDDGTQRDIDVIISGGMTLPQEEIVGRGCWIVKDFIEFIAHNPVFYDPTEVTSTTTLLSAGDELQFPITFPIEFGGSVINTTVTITYAGTWSSFPTIEIDGPLDDAIITNNSIGEKIELQYNIPLGETVTITLTPDSKTVVNDSGTNLIGVVTTNSDLATFRLEADPIASGGDNQIVITGGGANVSDTAVRIKYFTRYIGI